VELSLFVLVIVTIVTSSYHTGAQLTSLRTNDIELSTILKISIELMHVGIGGLR